MRAESSWYETHITRPSSHLKSRRDGNGTPRRRGRRACEQYLPEALNVVALALGEEKKLVDRITKGARMHA
jgi:hypothetical protein